MAKRLSALTAVALLGLLLAAAIHLGGCSPDSELGGLPIPNVLPDTRITGEPPNVVDAGFQVRFYWTGHDPDGKIKGYQWKLSTNQLDGISVQDTLTVDPATGDTLNPWHFTTRTDSLFIVTAEISNYPGDSELDATNRRSYQVHTIFVRAVDEEGGVDPTPDYLSFTATTLLPSIKVDRPTNLLSASGGKAPPTVTIGYQGTDPDFELNAPVQIRYLWKPAIGPDGRLVTLYPSDDRILLNMVSFADTAWSPWVPYGAQPDKRLITFPNQAAELMDSTGDLKPAVYLFAIQARDTAGAVTIERTKARTVLLVQIQRSMTPFLSVTEANLGRESTTGTYTVRKADIAQGQIMQFAWTATAEDYGGLVTAYRYGWDLADPEDENDPGWAVMPGNTLRHRQTDRVSFDSGSHTLIIQAWDNSGQLTRMTYVLTVVPVPPPSAQRDLLLIDDVPDRKTNAWPNEGGQPMDPDQYRDEFWLGVLSPDRGGLQNFNPNEDVLDTYDEDPTYRTIVNYKSVLWTTRDAGGTFIWDQFKPQRTGARYIWLNAYQEAVGNLFLVGGGALSGFIENDPPVGSAWMLPWIFSALDDRWCSSGGTCYGTGFGTEELPDGTEIQTGLLRYPYATMGLAILDNTAPAFVYQWPYAAQGRRSACAGLKGLRLDEDFASVYMPEGAPFPSEILTDPIIDWKDPKDSGIYAQYAEDLGSYPFARDEFYDSPLGSDRTTQWTPQQCGDVPCVDVMFRAYTRYEWINDEEASEGNPDWPYDLIQVGGNQVPRFTYDVLRDRCGALGLQTRSGGSEPEIRIAGVPVGFVSHKMEQNKPNPKGDVVWGFDPYRFNNFFIRSAIRWVLSEHFGLPLRAGK